MIVVVGQYNIREYAGLIDQMFRLRARMFHDRLKWDVRVEDGKERDRYDDEDPVYIIYADDAAQRVKGSLRPPADDGPDRLADIFPIGFPTLLG